MKRLFLSLLVGIMLVSAASCAGGNTGIGKSTDALPSDFSDSSEHESESTSEGLEIPPELYDAEPISAVLDLEENGAPSPCGTSMMYCHGGNQTRIVKTSHGVYCTYVFGEWSEEKIRITMSLLRSRQMEAVLSFMTDGFLPLVIPHILWRIRMKTYTSFAAEVPEII